ncbi:protein bric-a-brac 1-like [Ischnura elegans]|uniref:protein bric-a-brac 1-like n=1 Tax=Ischnura elegans TaxID=197161 RepID=UPI001ED87997|nr:protein bric-a-brac 1-like [Ischnura elegans]
MTFGHVVMEATEAKLLETSHAWLGASTSSITDNLGGSLESNYHLQRPLLNSFITSSLDQSLNKCDRRHITNSYQYQLQSMWQKCWNTNQSLVHNLRFRERGPLKSWRPETMAEAIFSVLKEGLSLSQSARKYDIPYPTFVLYANRVHNMLGPSIDGGSDLRPKGRGRPQRILLGNWPDDHIRGVIRAVVFRDTTHVKEESAHLSYPPRIQEPIPPPSPQNYPPPPPNVPSSNGPEPGTLSVAAAAAVAAVAQGLRQQLCASAMGPQALPPPPPPPVAPQASPPPQQQQQPDPTAGMAALANSLGSLGSGLGGLVGNSIGGIGGIGVSGMTYKPGATYATPRPENLFQEDIDEIVKSPLQQHGSGSSGVGVDDRVMSREPPPELQPVQVKMEQLAAEGHNE